jgi:hypothetical protein
LAKAIGISEKSAMRAVSELEERGHLEVTQRGNIGKSNIYKLKVGALSPAEDLTHLTSDTVVTPDDPVTPDNLVTPTLTAVSLSPGQQCPPNPLKEPSEEPFEKSVLRSPQQTRGEARKGKADDPGFAEFWQQYPNRVAKGAAERAYSKALSITTREEILAGVMRFAARRTSLIEAGRWCPEPKHPATWLNGKCWLDDPDPAVLPVNRPAATNSDRKSVMADVSQRLKGHAVALEDRAAAVAEAPLMRVIG